MNHPPFWLLVLFPAIFAVVWTAIMNLVARMGGWSRLAEVYRLSQPFEGYRTRFATGAFAGGSFFGLPCNYGSCLTLGSNSQGLYLAVFPVFRPGHPPLFIPWSDVTAQVKQGWLMTSTTFAFRQAPSVRLRIAHTLARQLVEEAGATHPLDLTDDQRHATQL
jgi:hypothetical protein